MLFASGRTGSGALGAALVAGGTLGACSRLLYIDAWSARRGRGGL